MEGRHILVLEDEAQTRTLIEKILAAAGYRVTAVADGKSALRAARVSQPDLAVCDLSMPGIDGYEVIRMLKRMSPVTPPIIVVSGRFKEKDKQDALEAGADVFLVKPVEREKLLAAVSECLAPAKPAPASAQAAGKKHVLVLEDEPLTLKMIMRLLEGAGYRVTGAADGETAYQAVQADPPDLVLTDLVVPGMYGKDFIKKLRNELAYRRPIIVVTGRSQHALEETVLQAGADSFLLKPVAHQLLLHHIANFLVRSR